jgi:hypothetical protein
MAQAADLATSESRIKAYNRDCFLRDGYRCAITGAYETNWFLNRYSKEEPPPDAQSAPCEAAHIIPHAMGSGSMVNNDFEVDCLRLSSLIISKASYPPDVSSHGS